MSKNKIYIKPSRRGSFTREAKKRGLSVQAFAQKVLANKSRYSKAMVKKAVFARNSRKWKKKEHGGMLGKEYGDGGMIDPGTAVGGITNIAGAFLPPLQIAAPFIEGLMQAIINKSNAIKSVRNHFNELSTSVNPYGLEDGGVLGEQKLLQYKGPSHDSLTGGIPVSDLGIPDINGENLVEGDEVLFNVGRRKVVFSKKLKI